METRKNIRLDEFDYSRNGCYFVTVCTKDRKCFLWSSNKLYDEETANTNVAETNPIVGATNQIVGAPNPIVGAPNPIVGATCSRPHPMSNENVATVDYPNITNNVPLSYIGKIIKNEIIKLNGIYPYIYVDKYVIMPNHIHLIIVIDVPEGDGRLQVAPTYSDATGNVVKRVTLSRIIKQFKMSVSKQVGCSIWQKSFYDKVIRNSDSLREIREYIHLNPLKWTLDEYFTKEEY